MITRLQSKSNLLKNVAFQQRASGILLHPTSLSGGHGTGDIGPEARRFAHWLHVAGQSYWQMLPLCPPGAVHSPYDSSSANAMSPLLISLEDLALTGLVSRHELKVPTKLRPTKRADFDGAWAFKEPILRSAHDRFRAQASRSSKQAYEKFNHEQSGWLDDFALFSALRNVHDNAPWNDWERPYRDRQKRAMDNVRKALARDIDYYRFVQFQLDKQWTSLHQLCRELGIMLMGDLPIYVAYDSADVWANRSVFHLDAEGRRKCVAGVPPDYFSKTGQLWGNPLYRWDALRKTNFSWWTERMRVILRRFDATRLDHFIGFRHYWEVPANAKTAEHGRYVRVPAEAFFDSLKSSFGRLPLLAEDLGVVTEEIHQLRARLGLPGMRILQFAFDDPKGSDYLPHRFVPDTVVYSGTHDNDTLMGWLHAAAPRNKKQAKLQLQVRARALAYVGSGVREVHWDFIRLALESVAKTAVFPIQDILGLGSEARMNTPGTVNGNWVWRLAPHSLREVEALRLRELCERYERVPELPSMGETRNSRRKA